MLIQFYSAVEMVSAVLCLFYFYNRRFHLDIKTIVFLSLNIIYVGLVSELHHFSFSILFYAALIPYCGLEFGFHIADMAVNILYTALTLCFLQFSGVMLYCINSHSRELDAGAYTWIHLYVLVILIYFTKKAERNKVSKFLYKWKPSAVFAVIYGYFAAILFMLQYRMSDIREIRICAIPLMTAGYICMITAFWKKLKQTSDEKGDEQQHLKIYEDAYRNMITDIRAKQHDFDNHLSAIMSQHYICSTYEELVETQKKYAEEVMEDNRFNRTVTSGNPFVTGFLYSKFAAADKLGIDITYRLAFYEMRCHVPISKIIVLLGNLYDNAVEALTGKEDKRLYVEIIETDERISMEIRNISAYIKSGTLASFFRKGYSEKGENRGMGLYNVKRICESFNIQIYCGNLEISHENWLSFRIVIEKPAQ